MAAQSEQPAAPMPTDDRAGGGWERVWDFLTSARCAAILTLLTAFAFLIAGIFPQAPAMGADSTAQLRWLAEAAARWGALGPTLRTLGLFQIAASPLWRGVLGLWVFVLLLHAAQELGRALRYAKADAIALPRRARGQRLADGDAARVLAALDGALLQVGYRTRVERSGDRVHLHAVRTGWAAWLRFGAALGLLLATVALLLSGLGSRLEEVALGPGETVALAVRAGWSVALEDGAEGGLWPVAVLGPEGEPISQGFVGPQHPLWTASLTLHMARSFPGVVVSATDGQGKPVPLQAAGESSAAGMLFLRFDEDQPEQYFAAPDVGDTVRLALNPAGNGTPAFAFQVFHGMDIQPAREGTFADETTTPSNGITYRFAAGQYPMLVATTDISRYPLWAGTVIAIACIVASAWVSARAALVQAAQVDNRVAVQYLASDAETEGVIQKALQQGT
ncbi:MAG: hypothetical protein QHH80_13645 [Anaerolineae bacterium]|nr:hypothetical protein [Anaerolineae bacterium]